MWRRTDRANLEWALNDPRQDRERFQVNKVEQLQGYAQEENEAAMASTNTLMGSVKTIATAHAEYNKKAFQDGSEFISKLTSLKSPDEADDYFNVPQAIRKRYLELFHKSDVRYVFAGHYHRTAGGPDGSLTEVVTGAVGMPLGGSSSGFRLVQLGPSGMKTAWYCLGNIPNRIENDLPKGGCSSGD